MEILYFPLEKGHSRHSRKKVQWFHCPLFWAMFTVKLGENEIFGIFDAADVSVAIYIYIYACCWVNLLAKFGPLLMLKDRQEQTTKGQKGASRGGKKREKKKRRKNKKEKDNKHKKK